VTRREERGERREERKKRRAEGAKLGVYTVLWHCWRCEDGFGCVDECCCCCSCCRRGVVVEQHALPACLMGRGSVNEAASKRLEVDPSTPHVESTSIRVHPCQSMSIHSRIPRPPAAPLIGSLACKPTANSVRLCPSVHPQHPPVSASIRQYPP
jgi:hypothetical protein